MATMITLSPWTSDVEDSLAGLTGVVPSRAGSYDTIEKLWIGCL